MVNGNSLQKLYTNGSHVKYRKEGIFSSKRPMGKISQFEVIENFWPKKMERRVQAGSSI
jgi:hypothetical protein